MNSAQILGAPLPRKISDPRLERNSAQSGVKYVPRTAFPFWVRVPLATNTFTNTYTFENLLGEVLVDVGRLYREVLRRVDALPFILR